MKNFYNILIAVTAILITAHCSVLAAPLSPDQALKRLKGNSKKTAAVNLLAKSPEHVRSVKSQNGNTALYLYNVNSEDGFLILSADDRITPLLGYSSTGNLSDSNLPDGLVWWMNQMADEIENTISDNESPEISGASIPVVGTAISPIVHARWGQTEPYNAYTPVINGDKTPTGCVATALTQIMYHYKWPEAPVGEVKYSDTSKPSNEYSMSYDGIEFEWNKMLDEYDVESSEESVNAVATLMKAVGYGVHMTYAKSGSGATDANALAGMTSYFGYSKDARMLRRESFNRSEWDALLYGMLSGGMPIYYTGRDAVWLGSGGHAFICDGYDGNGYFHFNWGWNDKYNGYFLTSSMVPSGAGTGGFINGYNYSQAIMINLHPDNEQEYALCDYVLGKDLSFSTSSLYCEAILTRGIPGSFEFGIRISSANNPSLHTVISLGSTEGGTVMANLPYNSLNDLDKDDIYDMKMIWRPDPDSEWRRIAGESSGFLVYNQSPMGGTLVCEDDVWKFNPGITDQDPIKLEISGININDEDYYISGSANSISFHVTNHYNDYANYASRCYVVDSQGNQTLFFNFDLTSDPNGYSVSKYNLKNTLIIPEGEYTLRFINVNTLQEIPCDKTYSITVYDAASLINHDDGSFKYVVVPGRGASLISTSTGSAIGEEIYIPAEITIEDSSYTVTKILPAIKNIIDKKTATSIVIDYPLTDIPSSTFSSIDNLTKLSLPESVRTIGKYAGAFNKAMTELILPERLDHIESSAFFSCYALENLRVPCVDTIPESCFWGIYEVPEINIPEGVRVIEDKAFYSPKKAVKIYLPSSLESLGAGAFGGYLSVSPLTDVVCNALTPPAIESSSFYNSAYKSATLHVPGGSTDLYATHPVWGKFSKIEELDLPNSIEIIENFAGENYKWLNINGIPLNTVPLEPGIYIRYSKSSLPEKIIIK